MGGDCSYRDSLKYVVVCVAWLAFAPAVMGATIYVDKNNAAADDGNQGTEVLPLKTIDRAMAVVQPGDHVYVKGGQNADDPAAIYDRSGKDGLPIQRPGTADNPIIIEAYPGDTVVLQGDGGRNGIALDYASYHDIRGFLVRNFNKAAEGFAAKTDILIEECEFTQTYETGLRLRNVTNFTMRDVYVHHCFESGISVREGTNVRFERVESSYNSDERGADGDGDGFHTYGGENMVFLDCVAKGNSEDGFDLNCNGVLIDCVSRDHSNACNVKLWCRVEDDYAPKRMILINCIISGAGETGIKVSNGAELHLYNSVLYGNGEEGIAFRELSGNPSKTPVYSTIVNTIIMGSGYEGIGVDGSSINIADADHNLYYLNGQDNNGLHSDANSISGEDPQFFGPASGMFQLREGSPAIDTGRTVTEVESLFASYSSYFTQGGAEDLDGDRRPSGAAWDIGADERVMAAGNTPPSFTSVPPSPPSEIHVDEGQTLSLQFQASDPQGDDLVFFLAGGDTVDEMKIDSEAGVFSFTPTYDQGGDNVTLHTSYDVKIGVTDATFTEPAAQATVRIVVDNVNRAPTYNGLDEYTMVEKRPWMFGIPAADNDGDVLSYSVTGLPSGAAFDEALGVLSWTPTHAQLGSHDVEFRVSDGAEPMARTVSFRVLPEKPYEAPTSENDIFYVSAANGSDTNNGQTEQTAWKTIHKAGASLQPGQMVLIRSGTYNEEVTPRSGTAGKPIIFKAYPGESPLMTGTGMSSPEAFQGGSHVVYDGLTFRDYGETIDLRGSTGDVTVVNCVVESANDYGIYGFAGDGLRVENVVLRNLGDRGIYGAGTNIHLYHVLIDTVADRGVSMSSSSCDNVTIIDSELSGAGRYGLFGSGQNVFVLGTRIHDNGQCGAMFDAKRCFLVHTIIQDISLFGGDAFDARFDTGSVAIVSDSILTQSARYGLYLNSGSQVILRQSIVSGNAQQDIVVQAGATLDSDSSVTVPGQSPQIGTIADQNVSEESPLSLFVDASDPDGGQLTYTIIGLPDGASFDSATGNLTWTPDNNQSGTYLVGFQASDGSTSASRVVTITVADVSNQAPVLTSLGPKNVEEESLLSFSVGATDADGDTLKYSCTSLPSGANFTNQVFSWIPADTQAGTYSVIFSVSDGELTDSEKVTIIVADSADLTDPYVGQHYPATGAIQVPGNSLISVVVSDTGRGVDAGSVVIRVNDQLVYSGNTASYESAYGACYRKGTTASYSYRYQTSRGFGFDETVTVRVTASDLAGNAMTPYVWSFRTEMRAFGDNYPASWLPADVDKGSPATVCDSAGNTWVVYHAGPAGQRDIYLSKLTAGGSAFGTPVQLTDSAADCCYPDIAVDADGMLYVVWQDNREGNWNVYATTSTNGVTWSGQRRVTESGNNQTVPAIAVDTRSPKRAYVAWQDDRASNADIYVAYSTDGFATKAAIQITSNSANQTAPSIAVDGDNTVYIVWTDRRNGSDDVYGAASDVGPWTNVALAAGAGGQSSADIACEMTGSQVHLVWVDNILGHDEIRYASSDGLPSSPLTGTFIVDDTSGADQTEPTIAVSRSATDPEVFVCWTDERNLGTVGADSDLYFVQVRTGDETNVLIGDGGTNSNQSEPVIGANSWGQPYVVWTDDRNGEGVIYYAGCAFADPTPIATGLITSSAGGTVGSSSPTTADDVSASIPAGACPFDATVTITRILNPQRPVEASRAVAYEFGPSGLEFGQPVTITIPYVAAEYVDGPPLPCWYDTLTGTYSQQGITNVQTLHLSATIDALRFRTTHFTPYLLLDGLQAVDGDGDGIVDPGTTPIDSGGAAGGGCSLTVGPGPSPLEFAVPYMVLAIIMVALKRRDRRQSRNL